MAEEKKKRGVTEGEPKTPAHVIEGRINVLFKNMISGAVLDTYMLREIAVINGWSVGDRQLINYRKKALSKFEELADVDLKQQIGLAKARYQHLYNKGITKNQLGIALAANDRLCTLQGLNAPAKHDVKVMYQQPIFKDD